MTPTEHRAEAVRLASPPASGRLAHEGIELEVGTVHAILATKAGTGTDYTAAEDLLDRYARAPWNPDLIARARIRAHLAA